MEAYLAGGIIVTEKDFVQISSLEAGKMYMGGSMCPPISFVFFHVCLGDE